jgi:hypothetical protein
MADGPSDPGSPKPPPEVLRELTPTGRRRFVFAGWEETPGGYRSLIELSTEAADDPAGLARAFLEALRTSELMGGDPGEPTGWRMVRGTHGVDYIEDPEGTDIPPANFREAAVPNNVRRLRSVPDEPVEADPEVREQAIADIRARLAQHDGDDPGSAA